MCRMRCGGMADGEKKQVEKFFVFKKTAATTTTVRAIKNSNEKYYL